MTCSVLGQLSNAACARMRGMFGVAFAEVSERFFVA